MKETPTGLADLARSFQALNPTRPQALAIARLLGLEGDIIFEAGPELNQPGHPTTATAATTTAAAAIGPDPEARGVFPRAPRAPAFRGWQHEPRVEPPGPNEIGLPTRLVERRAPPAGEKPSYVADAEELSFDSRAHRQLPDPAPLVPPGQLRSLITNSLIVPVPGALDILQLVEALARGRLPRVLPRKKRRGLASKVHVLLDTAGSMRLFRRDAAQLLRALSDVAGPAILSQERTSGPPWKGWKPPGAPGDTLLIVSDFGIGSRQLARRSDLAGWKKFSLHQQRRGLQLAGIVPFHFQRWPVSLTRRIRLVHWHRPGNASTPANARQTYRLALVLSLAAVIDPALLRAARMHFLPSADAGAEADFVNGPWTWVFNPRVTALSPSWTVELRSQLARDPALLEAAHSFLERQRPRSSDWDRVLFEEHIVYLSLLSSTDGPELLRAALARVIQSLLGRMRNPASARWALCFLEELPESAQQTEAAQVLKAVASIILKTSPLEVVEIVAAQNAKWIFHRNTKVGVAWTGKHILVREPPAPGDQVLEVPDTWPRVVIVADIDRPRKKVLQFKKRSPPAWTRATFLPRLLTTASGAESRLDDARKEWDRLHLAFEAGQTLTGVVKGPCRGGYLVDVGLDAVLPNKRARSGDGGTDDFIGSTVEVKITHLDQATWRLRVALNDASPFAMDPETWKEIEKRFEAMELVPGVVTAIRREGYVVNVLGVETFVPLGELPLREQREAEHSVGETLSFCIVALDKKSQDFTLSRMFDQFEAWSKLLKAKNEKKLVAGRVEGAVRGGFLVAIGLWSVYVPFNHVTGTATARGDDPSLHIGKTYEFQVLNLKWERRIVFLTRHKVLQQERAARQLQALAEIVEGEVRKGIVRNLVDYGAFIDLGGADGLLHISEMSWTEIEHPSILLRKGQEIEVKVLKVDRESVPARITLGLKQLTTDPWDVVESKYPVGARIKRRVVALMDYGAFIEIEPGVHGLLHIKEMSSTNPPEKASDLFSKGDEVEVVVLAVDRAGKKLALGIRNTGDDR
jgi:ribosomal protein S1